MFAHVKGCDGVLARKEPIHPDVDPAKDGDEERGDHADEKPSSGRAAVKDGDQKRNDIK